VSDHPHLKAQISVILSESATGGEAKNLMLILNIIRFEMINLPEY
jgi:hypothetical protein